MIRTIGIVTFAVVLLVATPALPGDGPQSEARQTFERFVAAQNAHDARAVRDLLWDAGGFLWITRGNVIWGREEALRRFEANYEGTWKLEPDMAGFRVTILDANTVHLFVPLIVTSGPAGQAPQAASFHMNQTLVRTPLGWKVATILPIPVPR
jgi:hypothetical protein